MNSISFIPGKVAAVIPVYNEERFLRRCLESVVGQVDRIILGDNASTDATEAICREFAEKYSHVHYFRQEKNLGAAVNFVDCCKLIDTEFFFHIGGHDVIPTGFVAALKETILEHPDAIAAYADSHPIDQEGRELPREEYDNPRSQNKRGRMIASAFASDDSLFRAREFIFRKSPCDLIYALFRTRQCVQEWMEPRVYSGPDVVLLFNLLLRGKFVHTLQTVFHRRLLNDGKENWEGYMERISGKKMKIDHAPMIDAILRSYKEQTQKLGIPWKTDGGYRRLLRWAAMRYGYRSGNFWLDIYAFFRRGGRSLTLFVKSRCGAWLKRRFHL